MIFGGYCIYKNGNYNVAIDVRDGTKFRFNDEDELIPDTYESIDMCISKKCSNGCPFCYSGCSNEGENADIINSDFIDKLHPYTEIAINGNEPLHPNLPAFLERCREKNLIPSITVNQKTWMKYKDELNAYVRDGLLYGIGVSLDYDDMGNIRLPRFVLSIKDNPNVVVHVINGMVSVDKLRMMSEHGLKILVLGYKDIGFGGGYHEDNMAEIVKRQRELNDALPEIIEHSWFDVVSFDNLALEQLDVEDLMDEEEWSAFYLGPDGKTSFYVDLVDGTYSKSSLSATTYPMSDVDDDPQKMLEHVKAVNGLQ